MKPVEESLIKPEMENDDIELNKFPVSVKKFRKKSKEIYGNENPFNNVREWLWIHFIRWWWDARNTEQLKLDAMAYRWSYWSAVATCVPSYECETHQNPMKCTWWNLVLTGNGER